MADRTANVSRDTLETRISIEINLDGEGRTDLSTGLPFFEHMLDQVARHGLIDITLRADGDLEVDAHHTVEDVGITFGQAVTQAVGSKAGLTRYGHAYVPLDEALSRAVIDFSGRPGLQYRVDYVRPRIGDFDVDLFREFFQGFVNHALVTVHLDNLRGVNAHHQAETLFKAFGRALRMALAPDPRMAGQMPSTKGTLEPGRPTMLLIPAIDLKNGECVRLRQGRMEEATVFSSDPVAMAEHWLAEGARRLHIVDLDGAFEGRPANGELIRRMVAAVGTRMPVQVGGGVRSFEVIDGYLQAGVAAVIIGTQAVRDPEFLAQATGRFPGRVILGLDARDGRVATEGWDQTSAVTAVEFAERTRALDLAAIVYTDIERDGMMQGLNVPATLQVAAAAGTQVIASGGVTNLEDLKGLLAATAAAGANAADLLGVITGRAVYEGTLSVSEGQALLDAG